jgi:iron(III) transport system permease protein
MIAQAHAVNQASPVRLATAWFALGDRALISVIALFAIAVVAYPVLRGLRAVDSAALLELFSQKNYLPVKNSALAALLTLPPSLLLAVPMAWLCARTNLPYRRLISALVGTSFVMPMLFTCIAYVFLFGKNAGLINVFFQNWIGGPLYDIHSFSGVVLVAVLQCYPLVFFTTMSGLSKMNPELEEAARISGMSGSGVFWRITVGTILPSVMAGVAFAFATAVTMLSGPLILAVPVGIPFVTSEMYAAIVMQANIGRAVTLSLPLLAMSLAALWLQSRLIRDEASRFTTVGGKGGRAAPIDLGPWRFVALLFCAIVLFVSLVLPLLVLLSAGLMDAWWKGFALDNLTFKHFIELFNSTTTRHSILNSVVLSVGAAGFLAFFGTAMAIVLSGSQSYVKRALRSIAMIPLGIAHVVAGVIVILAWYGPPLELGGTPWLLALGYVLVMLPYALKTAEAGRGQIETWLEDAARVCGCSPLASWRHVLLPLMKHSIFTTFVIVFLFCIKEFPMTALIYSANTQTFAVRVYSYFEGGNFEQCGAAAVVLLGIAFVTLFISSKVFGLSVADGSK